MRRRRFSTWFPIVCLCLALGQVACRVGPGGRGPSDANAVALPAAGSEAEPIAALETFLGYLAGGDAESAYALVAPSSKETGDPVAYNAPLDYDSFVGELTPMATWPGREAPTQPIILKDVASKFSGYKLGAWRWESEKRFRIRVTFGGWDNDEVLLVYEHGGWFVANPIHVIR